MKFYSLSLDKGRRKHYAVGIPISESPFQEVICSICGLWHRDLFLEDEQREVQIIPSNDHFPDFMSFSIYNILVSDTAKQELDQENISGFDYSKCKVYSVGDITENQRKYLKKEYGSRDFAKFSTDKPNYSRIIVNGYAELDLDKSKVELGKCQQCSRGILKTTGFSYINPHQPKFIQLNTWSGHDLFRVKYFPAITFCSEKFVEVYKKYNLKGLVFQEVEYIE